MSTTRRCRLEKTPSSVVGVLAGGFDRPPDGMEVQSQHMYHGRINAGMVAAHFTGHPGDATD